MNFLKKWLLLEMQLGTKNDNRKNWRVSLIKKKKKIFCLKTVH